MNHKSAWAEEERAPSKEAAQSDEQRQPKRIIVSSSKPQNTNNDYPKEILIVASKLKSYVKDRYDINTSAGVMDKLSDLVRELTDRAVTNAKAEGRKTLMDRDF